MTPMILAARGQPGGPVIVTDILAHTGAVFFVGNAVTGAADDTGHGFTPEAPLATIDYAIGLCTAAKGDIIYVLPYHNEGLGNAQITADVAGITIEGIGRGGSVPRIDYDHANASIDVNANNVAIRNLRLLPSVTAVLIGIDVMAGKTDTLIEDVEVLPGEDGAGVDEMTIAVDIKAGCTRTTVRRVLHRQHATAAGVIAPIKLTGASDFVTIEKCDIVALGAGVTAPIAGDTTLSTNLRIIENRLVTDNEPGIELLTGTKGIIARNIITTDLATIAAAIVADAMDLVENYYVETGQGETGALIGTASANDA